MTRSRLSLVLVVLAAAVLVVACGGKGNRDAEAAGLASDTIVMKDSEFRPNHAAVSRGTTVTWQNDDQYPHDVAFTGGPQSPTLDSGGTYQRTFDEAGTFDYECTIHPGMVGRVTVTEG
jgi:plastocyanin